MAIVDSIKRLTPIPLMTKQAIRNAWSNNPERLFNFLGMQSDRSGTGILCPYCGSGSGDRGTGMQFHYTEHRNLRMKCFACNCEKNVDAFNLVMDFHDEAPGFEDAHRILSELYATEESEYDSDIPRCNPRRTYRTYNITQSAFNEQILPIYHRSIQARRACSQWLQRLADTMRLPVSVFNRPDIGKAFYKNHTGYSDELNEDCGDLVTYTLCDGKPIAAKVRYTPGLNSYDGFMLYYDPNRADFYPSSLKNPDTHHDFRMAGQSGRVCFGHDYIRDAESVIIVEGQSDVLATVAAFQSCGMHSYTAIGRDNGGHILTDIDLSALAGKRVIYASDYDTIDSDKDKQNCALLANAGCSVQRWAAPSAAVKDTRAVYISDGPDVLVDSLLTAPSLPIFNSISKL